MMKVLFLSIKVATANVLDEITYTFIMKEMRALAAAGVMVFFYSDAFDRPINVGGIHCFGRDKLASSRIRLALYVLRRIRFFLPLLLRDWRAAWWVAVTECNVRQKVATENIDVIHTHFLWPQGECCELTSKELGVPIVATLRGAELHNEPALDYGAMRDATFRRNFASAKRRISHFTAPNAGLIEQLVDQHGIPKHRCSLVFNGVEHLAVDLPIRVAGRPVVFIAVGHYIKLKNHIWLIQTLSRLRGGPPFVLRLYGFGPEREKLRKAIEVAGMDNVQLCDVLPKEKIVRVMRDADALLHPSLMEGLPNVVLESLAVGTPVIVSDIAGHRDIVNNGYNGFRFSLEEPAELVDIVSAILQQPDRLVRLAPNCLASAKRFSLDDKIAKYLAIYADALERHRA